MEREIRVRFTGDATDIRRASEDARRSLTQMGNEVSASSRRTADELRNLERQTVGLGGVSTNLASTLGKLAGGFLTVAAAAETFKRGINYNAEIESLRLGIATIVSANETIRDSQGRQIEGAQKLALAQGQVAEVFEKLKQDAVNTTATLPQLAQAFNAALAPAMAMGISLDDTRKMTVGLVQAMGAMGIPLDQARQEINSILQATISEDSQLAKNLGLNNEMVKTWRDQGVLVDRLQDKLRDFTVAGAAAGQTWAGATSTLQDNLDTLLGRLTEDSFAGLTKAVNDINEAFKGDMGSDLNKIADQFGAGLADALGQAKLIAADLGKVLLMSAKGYGELLQRSRMFMVENDRKPFSEAMKERLGGLSNEMGPGVGNPAEFNGFRALVMRGADAKSLQTYINTEWADGGSPKTTAHNRRIRSALFRVIMQAQEEASGIIQKSLEDIANEGVEGIREAARGGYKYQPKKPPAAGGSKTGGKSTSSPGLLDGVGLGGTGNALDLASQGVFLAPSDRLGLGVSGSGLGYYGIGQQVSAGTSLGALTGLTAPVEKSTKALEQFADTTVFMGKSFSDAVEQADQRLRNASEAAKTLASSMQSLIGLMHTAIQGGDVKASVMQLGQGIADQQFGQAIANQNWNQAILTGGFSLATDLVKAGESDRMDAAARAKAAGRGLLVDRNKLSQDYLRNEGGGTNILNPDNWWNIITKGGSMTLGEGPEYGKRAAEKLAGYDAKTAERLSHTLMKGADGDRAKALDQLDDWAASVEGSLKPEVIQAHVDAVKAEIEAIYKSSKAQEEFARRIGEVNKAIGIFGGIQGVSGLRESLGLGKKSVGDIGRALWMSDSGAEIGDISSAANQKTILSSLEDLLFVQAQGKGDYVMGQGGPMVTSLTGGANGAIQALLGAGLDVSGKSVAQIVQLLQGIVIPAMQDLKSLTGGAAMGSISGAGTGENALTFDAPQTRVINNQFNITISAGAFTGNKGEARQFANWMGVELANAGFLPDAL